MATMKFNIGDSVRRINYNNGGMDCNFKVGQIGKVIRIAPNGFVTVEVNGEVNYGNDPRNLELVAPKTSKFKVGDRVLASDNLGFYKNQPGTVVHSAPSRTGTYWVKFDDESKCNCKLYADIHELIPTSGKIVITHDGKTTTATLYREDGGNVEATARCAPEDTFDFNVGAKLAMERLMEKVEKVKTPEPPKMKFKTGDYAKIIANEHGHQFEIGTIVRLEKHVTNYKAIGDGDFWWVEDDELEAYTPPKYYNGKVICVDSGSIPKGFTVGKIYNFVDGRCKSDRGTPITATPVTNCDDLNSRFFNVKFIPLVD